jgi:hypothetical protein
MIGKQYGSVARPQVRRAALVDAFNAAEVSAVRPEDKTHAKFSRPLLTAQPWPTLSSTSHSCAPSGRQTTPSQDRRQ